MLTMLPKQVSPISIQIHSISNIQRSTPMQRANPPTQSHAVARIGTLVVIGVIALALLGLTIASWRSISPGYVGIVFDKANHNVTAGALEPGWAFINPFTQALQEYPITIQNYSMVEKSTEGQTAGDDSIKVQS